MTQHKRYLSFFYELKRRNVIRVGAVYMAGSWLLLQVADVVLPGYNLDQAWISTLITILAIGFPLALIFAWVYQLTPEGLKRETEVDRAAPHPLRLDKQLDRIIILVLALALGIFAVDKFLLAPKRDAERSEKASQVAVERVLEAQAMEAPAKHSIAVLPFMDMSEAGDQAYFSDGLAEELLNLLTWVPGLLVTSRTSAFSFKGRNVPVAEIASQLKVAHILEGSVRLAGDRVRVTAQLIDTSTDVHLWSDSWDREAGDVFAIQDEIAAAVVDELQIRLAGDVPRARMVDPEAHALFLRASYIYSYVGRGDEQLAQIEPLVRQALEISPEYSRAWSLLGRVYAAPAFAGYGVASERLDFAESFARKALELDPTNSDAYSLLAGLVSWDDVQLYATNQALAFQHAPADSTVLIGTSIVLRTLGRLDEAIALNEWVVKRDPLLTHNYAVLALHYYMAGRFEDALRAHGKTLLLHPDYPQTYFEMGEIYLALGEPETALEHFGREVIDGYRLVGQALAHHELGDADKYHEAMADCERFGNLVCGYGYFIVDDLDQAWEWLDTNLYDIGPLNFRTVTLDPLFAHLKNDPRTQLAAEKLGVSDAQLAEIEFDITLPE